MRFSLPELPDSDKYAGNTGDIHEDRQHSVSSGHRETGSYEALMAKLGKKVAHIADNAAGIASRDNAAEDDDGYEVDSEQAKEAEAAMPPHLPGPAHICARLLSWIMVPMVMPVLSMALMIWLTDLRDMDPHDKSAAVLMAAGLNTLLPIVLIFLLKVIGVVHDVGLNSRRERLVPYLITITGLVCTAVYLRLEGAPGWMWGTYTGAAIASAICCVVNLWWKISAHATAAAGVIATIAVIGTAGNAVVALQWWLFAACIMTGMMGSARVLLRRHTDMQVLAGYLCGFCSVYFTSLVLV